MALVNTVVAVVAEAESAESEELLTMPPIAYGIIAFALLLVLLLVTTRLDLDR
jgi:hypothetical protein